MTSPLVLTAAGLIAFSGLGNFRLASEGIAAKEPSRRRIAPWKSRPRRTRPLHRENLRAIEGRPSNVALSFSDVTSTVLSSSGTVSFAAMPSEPNGSCQA